MSNNFSVLLVGCGKMGGALATRWLRQGVLSPRHLVIIEPEGTRAVPEELSYIDLRKSPSGLSGSFQPDVIVFAVKPQALPGILPLYAKRFSGQSPLILSIAAGTKVSSFSKYFGADAPIVRAMPNMPALIGNGITVAFANAHVHEEIKHHAAELLRAVGELLWVENEAWMDAATAISGSGPAYIFYFVECLAKAGQSLGLPADIAHYLALITTQGSSELAVMSGQKLSALREQVASKGGTTEAALKVLMRSRDGLEPLLKKTAKAARDRAKELSKTS